MSQSTLAAVQSLIRSGEPAKARELLAAEPGNRVCMARLRELLIGEGDYDAGRQVALNLASGSDVEAHVSRSFLAMLQGDLRAALGECQRAVQMDSKVATIHNHAGRALHNAGQGDQAINALRQAIALDPDYAEAWHNLGHVLRAMGRLDDATGAYNSALELSPGYRSARLNLGKTLFNQERIEEALNAFETLLEQQPADAEALTDAGLALHLLGQRETSREYYERALSMQPSATTLVYLAVLMNELQDDAAATRALEQALEMDPQNADAWVELAGTHELCNRLDEANDAVEKGLAIAPQYAPLQLEAAKLEHRRGEFDASFKRLATINVDDLPARLRKPYYFQMASAMDRLGQTDKAHGAYISGNSLAAQDARRARLDTGGYLNRCQKIDDWIEKGAQGMKAWGSDPEGDTGADICFLHGFTRSGTTLLDMMLGVHPDVLSLQEVPTFEAVLQQLDDMSVDYPEGLAALGEDRVIALRQTYRQAVADAAEGQSGKIIVDKMPMRFIHTGLIKRVFPDARILFSLRHPCDVVLSNFMQQYPSNSDFLVNFDSLHGGAVVYDATMRIWQKLESLIDGPITYLKYEDLVTDAESAAKAVCQFLGVEMTPEMLDTSARMNLRDRVITPSYQQVSEPLYQRAVDRWRRYEAFLQPEMGLLEAHISRYGYR